MTSIDKFYEEHLDQPAVTLGYAAVPLDLRTNERTDTYRMESLGRIRQGLTAAVECALEHEWVRSEHLANELAKLVDRSLTESHERRIFFNRRYDKAPLGNVVDMSDDRVARAVRGEASPVDLLSMLQDYPTLGSIELAKLSHPLDVSATIPMDADIFHTLEKFDAHEDPGEPRHKLKSYDLDIPAMTMLRKQAVGSFATSIGDIQVVRRQEMLIRGDNEARELDPLLDRKIRNPNRLPEVIQKMEAYLLHAAAHPDLQWLQPITTSYYAKYLTSKSEVE